MELAGYTSRVGDMLDVFEDASSGKYNKTLVTGTEAKNFKSLQIELKDGQPIVKGKTYFLHFHPYSYRHNNTYNYYI